MRKPIPLGVSPGWVALFSALIFLPPYWALARLEPYASRTAAEIDFDVFLVRMISVLIPYVIFVSFRGIAKTQMDLRSLRPILDLSDEKLEELAESLSSLDRRRFAAFLGFSFVLALFFQQSGSQRITQVFESPSAADYWLLFCGTAAWTVVLITVWSLLRNARALQQAATHVDRIDPFDTEPLRPFGRAGLRMALYLMGGIAIFQTFGVLSAPADVQRVGITIASASVAPAVIIFLLPTWGVHVRQRQHKAHLLRRIHSDLGGRGEPSEGALRPLLDLLEYRDRIRHASEWPFDTSAVLRLALYTVIPLASWVAAALVERLLDRIL